MVGCIKSNAILLGPNWVLAMQFEQARAAVGELLTAALTGEGWEPALQTVFELDCWGRVLRYHGDFSERVGVAIRDKRLVALDRVIQDRLQKAVAAAILPPQRSATAVIVDVHGSRKYVQVLPVSGRARDLFLATAAIAVILDYSTDIAMSRLKSDTIREAF